MHGPCPNTALTCGKHPCSLLKEEGIPLDTVHSDVGATVGGQLGGCHGNLPRGGQEEVELGGSEVREEG